jgi:tRNA modification GTPase
LGERATICALASGALPAAIAIVRISGPSTRAIAADFLAVGLPIPRRAVLTDFSDADGRLIDRGLAIFMAGPHTYTGEDTLELHLHGGAAVVEHALRHLTSLPGVRLAEPGEFTCRAFEAGKLDLVEAEGVADLIEAETEAQKAQALRQVAGGLSAVYTRWRGELTILLALIEVAVDFPDEADVPTDAHGPVAARFASLIGEIETALGDGGIGERIRDGFHIALIGAPNTGKSTLLNRLAGREAAIVTPQAGTTRDVIEIRRRLGGQIVWIADTAGLRETDDVIEAEGVRRAKAAAETADLRVFLIDASDPDFSTPIAAARRGGDLVVCNKSDLAAPPPGLMVDHVISARSGYGVDALETELAARIMTRAQAIEAPVITRFRHREKLSRGLVCLAQAAAGWRHGVGAEFIAEDVRLALRTLGAIIGTVNSEDVLSEVFSRFCIGK